MGQAREDKSIKIIARTRFVRDLRHRNLPHGTEGPMGFVFSALFDPEFQQRLFLSRKRELACRGWHTIIFIRGRDAPPQLAPFRMMWDNSSLLTSGVTNRISALSDIQPEFA